MKFKDNIIYKTILGPSYWYIRNLAKRTTVVRFIYINIIRKTFINIIRKTFINIIRKIHLRKTIQDLISKIRLYVFKSKVVLFVAKKLDILEVHSMMLKKMVSKKDLFSKESYSKNTRYFDETENKFKLELQNRFNKLEEIFTIDNNVKEMILYGHEWTYEELIYVAVYYKNIKIFIVSEKVINKFSYDLDLIVARYKLECTFVSPQNHFDESNEVIDEMHFNWNKDFSSFKNFDDNYLKDEIIISNFLAYDDLFNTIYKSNLALLNINIKLKIPLLNYKDKKLSVVNAESLLDKYRRDYQVGLEELVKYQVKIKQKLHTKLRDNIEVTVEDLKKNNEKFSEISEISLFAQTNPAGVKHTIQNKKYFTKNKSLFLLIKPNALLKNSFSEHLIHDSFMQDVRKQKLPKSLFFIKLFFSNPRIFLLLYILSKRLIFINYLYIFGNMIMEKLPQATSLNIISSRNPLGLALFNGLIKAKSNIETNEFHFLDPMIGNRFYFNYKCKNHYFRIFSNLDYVKELIDISENNLSILKTDHKETDVEYSLPLKSENQSSSSNTKKISIGIALKTYSITSLSRYIISVCELTETKYKEQDIEVLVRFHPKQTWREVISIFKLLEQKYNAIIKIHTGNEIEFLNRIDILFGLRGTMLSHSLQKKIPTYVYKCIDYPFFENKNVKTIHGPEEFYEETLVSD